MCLFKIFLSKKLVSQASHFNGFFPLWTPPRVEPTYGFFPSWTHSICFFNLLLAIKSWPQIEHACGFFPSWTTNGFSCGALVPLAWQTLESAPVPTPVQLKPQLQPELQLLLKPTSRSSPSPSLSPGNRLPRELAPAPARRRPAPAASRSRGPVAWCWRWSTRAGGRRASPSAWTCSLETKRWTNSL